jgi:CheY-like chemotaxis protein
VDLEMPGADGKRLATLIRQDPALAGTALVLLAPLRMAADAERWRRLGFAGHVAKPVKQGELGTCLASILGYGPAPARPGAQSTPAPAGRARRERLTLLVVEDNRVNREVALGILANLGYPADVVCDGPAALRALGEKHYDLVLLDCRMPGMDGYEVAQRIRGPASGVRNPAIPIIATTAQAMAGDREKCLAAGMSDYVTKPLRPRVLEQKIEEWTRGIPVPPAAAPAPTPAAGAAFARDEFIERMMGNEDMAQRILRGFVDDMPRQLALLAQAVDNRDAAALRLAAHSIKGAAANVGGTEIQEIAGKLERTGTAGDLAAAAAALPELAASFDRARPAMEKFCTGDT